MDLKQLDALAAVADHRTFSGAALALNTVQSNVSTHIAKLEGELGVTLVDRANNTLTPEGRVVVDRTRRIAAELRAMVADVASVQADVVGEARVGLIGTVGRMVAPPLLRELGSRYPRVHAVIVEATTNGLLPQLTSGQVDLAVVHLPIERPDFAVEPLFEEDLVVVVPDDHALVGADALTLAEVAEHRLLLGSPETAMRRLLDEAASKAGVVLEPMAELDGVRLTASLAFDGLGPAIVPVSAVPRWLTGPWRTARLSDGPRREVSLLKRQRAQPSAPAHALEQVLRDSLTDLAGTHEGIYPV